MRIEAPATGEQALTAKHLVDTRDAAVKLVASVENSGVGVGDLRTTRKHRIEVGAVGFCVLHGTQQLDRARGPNRPLAEQAAHEARRAIAEAELGEEGGDDIVVIA